MDWGERPSGLRKGEWGQLLLLAGSSNLAGAAVLAAGGALRTGLDTLVTVAPVRAANAVLAAYPDAITIGIQARQFEPSHTKYVSGFDGYPVAAGSGIGLAGNAQKFIKQILDGLRGPFVLDADALQLVAAARKPAKLYEGKAVLLTPNRKEYQWLSGSSDDPRQTIAETALRFRATILCKGPRDVVSDGDRVEEVTGGASILARSGTGDVLTGVVGALVARGVPLFDAAVVGARAVKRAGERGAAAKGGGLLASDLPGYLDLRELA